ncbi:MAG: DUF1800 domain-containing protein [Leeuwenhoekiella sp.]
MKQAILWSLRLGFSAAQTKSIDALGIKNFLEKSFAAPFSRRIPECLIDEPQTLEEYRELRKSLRLADDKTQKQYAKESRRNAAQLRVWWLKNMETAEFPLRENLTCFWHNHFVSTLQKVKINRWVYEHNQTLREHALGNLRDLTKAVIKTNAMVRYLDNAQNRRGNLNENLSRELLELFTLGIGNYTETDIREGAKALAGLTVGNEHADYRPVLRVNESITYLGKTGNFDSDDLVDIIFDQPESPYLITRKLLQWFLYDNPEDSLVRYYGDYLRKVDFEIKPFLIKLFTEEFEKNNTGSKIKDPLRFALQSRYELGLSSADLIPIVFFLKQQGMDLFNQPNVKGWDGGRSWLTSQLYLNRGQAIDLMCRAGGKGNRRQKMMMEFDQEADSSTAKIEYSRDDSRDEILEDLKSRWLFAVEAELDDSLKTVLPYDFDPTAEYADQAILRLFSYVAKTPEFQLI